MPKDDLVEQLHRYRDEQRAARAARRGGPAATATVAASRSRTPDAAAPRPARPALATAAEPPHRPERGVPIDRDDGDGGGEGRPGAGPARDDRYAFELSTAGGEAPPPPTAASTPTPGAGDGGDPRELWLERIRTGVRGMGQTFITFGVVILLFVVYEVWITGFFTQHKQGQLTSNLAQEWQKGDDPTIDEPGTKVREIPIGQGIALIRIPALGPDYVRAVVEGTSDAALAEGPGHYVSTVLPGQVGNFAIAGHRVGKGSPFLDLDRLRAGDAIVIETREYYYVYRVLGDVRTGNPEVTNAAGVPGMEIVQPTDINVIAPVPDHPGQAPTQRLLTLTTCHPKFSAEQRLIIHAKLDGAPWPKSKGLPPALTN